jgi:DNA-binding XRE family transcriptional regulator
MNRAWKNEVLARLDELGMTQSALAKAAGVSAGTITLMLREEPDQASSVAVEAVSKVLGIGMPAVDLPDRVSKAVRALDERGQALLLQLAEDMAGRQGK